MCVSARHKLKDLLHSPVIVNFSFSSKKKKSVFKKKKNTGQNQLTKMYKCL